MWACLIASFVRAGDARQEITAELGEIASALSAGNAEGVMKRVAASLPERDLFEGNVRGMLQLAQVATTLEAREWKTEGARTVVVLDWFLELRRSGEGSVLATQRRRQLVEAVWEKAGKRWKIVALKPMEFFAPPASQ